LNNYYAEFETDRIIRESYFPDFSYKGTMVEVGAATPDFISMSRHFRETGWRCICIDPNPKYVEMHRLAGSEIYPYACSDEDKDGVDFQVVHKSDDYAANVISDQSYSALKVKDNYLAHDNITIHDLPVVNIKVNVRKLDTVLSQLKIKHVDYVSIDVEGWELEVMRGFNTRKYKPEIILLENYTHSPQYREYMGKIGYTLDKQVEYNYIFKRN
jgi:FkbM family methyltransferase